jgi:cytochrome c-type biogenesis protein CcmH/NrfG
MRARIDAEKLSTERESLERLAKQRADEADAMAKLREEDRKKAEAALLLASTQQNKKPVYKRAWFWVVIGGVVVAGAVGVGLAVALQSKDPASDLGTRMVTF